MNFPKIAIVYLSYHSDPYLSDMVSHLEKINYPKEKLALVIVDNPHPLLGNSLDTIKELVLPKAGKSLPETFLLPQEKNTGFSGGNNVGMSWALEHGFDFIFLHNQDGYVHPDCLLNLALAMENDQSIGCSQALIMLAGKGDLVNTAGNSFNYLGFAYIDHFARSLSSMSLEPVEEIGYASGSGLMLRSSLVKKFGGLDEDLFLYHEDVEYSLRLKLAGFKIAVVTGAIFYHKYEFNRSSAKFYFLERNRYAVLLMYYKWPTIVLLIPMLIIMEFGLLAFFIMHGWYKEKIKFYKYWFNPTNWKIWLEKRKRIQALRTVPDREILKFSTGIVYFGEKKEMNNPLLLYVANPLMRLYKLIVQALVFW